MVLELSSLAAEKGTASASKASILEAHQGETIGLAGMEGSGQSLRSAGLRRAPPAVGGRVFPGKARTSPGKPTIEFKRRGSLRAAHRLEEGLIPGLTLTEHFLLAA